MARKKIREFTAKQILLGPSYQGVLVGPETNLDSLEVQGKLVAKPDMLFGKRGKLGLIKIGLINEIKEFILEHKNKEIVIGKAKGILTHWLIEPYIEHDKEYYLSFTTMRDNDIIHFSNQGGVEVEDNWHQVKTIKVPVLEDFNEDICENPIINQFAKNLFKLFREFHFTYLEINPFAIKSDMIHVLDTVARVDSCTNWTNFPQPFGKVKNTTESFIENLDQNSGASIKLTILNQYGKIWNILGGGGASIIYLDMIANLGKGEKIANYGEASGNPSNHESYLYAKSILQLMLKNEGKILFIVGGIANFTDVKATFSGYIKALQEFGAQLKEKKIRIFIRRGGPNWQQGLQLITDTCKKLGIDSEVHGPDTSMPEIIKIAKERL
jgi:ATP-citrate lyase beta-subunit